MFTKMATANGDQSKLELKPIDLFYSYIILLSVVSIGFLFSNSFKSENVFLVTNIAWLCIAVVNSRRFRICLDFQNITPILLLILLSFCLRYPGYLTVLGGSDEGVYLSMAQVLEENGSPILIDKVRSKLPEAEKVPYDQSNNSPFTAAEHYQGNHLPGVDILNFNEGKYVFQFYPLHSVYLALTSHLLDKGKSIIYLQIVGAFSILLIYLLTIELKFSRTSAFGAAGLLATNPLHIFFSKYPSTEVLVLFFSLSSFYYLLRAINGSGQFNKVLSLLFSGLLFGLLCFTHIRGFLYIPFLFLIWFYSNKVDCLKQIRPELTVWFVLALSLFGASLYYGMHFSPPYFYAIFSEIFGILHVKNTVAVVSISAIGLLLGLYLDHRYLKEYFTNLLPYAPVVLLIILFVTLIKSALFSFTGFFTNYGAVGMANQGWNTFIYSVISFAAVYLTPLGLLVLVIGSYSFFRKRQLSPIQNLFVLMLAFFWLIAYPAVPDYIRARYLLVEIFPYSLLFISVFCLENATIGNKASKLKTYSFGAMIVFSFTLSLFIQTGKVKDGNDLGLGQIDGLITKQDLIYFEISDVISTFQKMPLEYFYNKNVIAVKNFDGEYKNYSSINQTYARKFLLTSSPRRTENNLTLIREFQSKAGYFDSEIGVSNRVLLTRYFYWFDRTMRLYEIKSPS